MTAGALRTVEAPAPAIDAAVARFVTRQRDRFRRELQAFVRIPSVSVERVHADDVRRCAAWLAADLHRIGLSRVRTIATPRHPIVCAEWMGAPRQPTVLVYGHYDVQPGGDAKAWHHPPFGGLIEGGFLHGRGASDDKGQLFAHVKAIESLLATRRRLPVNVRCLFEGEEEIGSGNLLRAIAAGGQALRADAAVMSDTRMLGPDQPALTYGLRGQLAFELRVEGQRGDLHSGNFGGAVHDPLQALCEIVAQLHDRSRRIAVPGFYARVRRAGGVEREYLAGTGPSDDELLREAGTSTAWGERGYSAYERVTLRPSLAVTGIQGGYTGDGPKGVIPHAATAKLSFRLVPDQDPHDIERRVRRFVAAIAPPTVTVTMATHIRSRPALIDRAHPAMRAAAAAYRAVFGRGPRWVRSGGSIPVVSEFARVLGMPTVLMGFASPGDGLHGANERFSLKNFERGILTSAVFLERLRRP